MMFRTLSLCLNPKLLRVCDVGGGRGEMSRHLAQSGAEVAYLDYSSAACDIMSSIKDDLNISVFNASATEIGSIFEPRTFDLVFSNQCIQYLDAQEMAEFIEDCAKLLRPGGHLVFNSPERKRAVEDSRAGFDGYAKKFWNGPEIEQIMRGHFPYAEAFTWDGFERFDSPGQSVMLFGVACVQPYGVTFLPTDKAELEVRANGAWDTCRATTKQEFGNEIRFEFDIAGRIPDGANPKFQIVLSHSRNPVVPRMSFVPEAKFDGEVHRILQPARLFSDLEDDGSRYDTIELRVRAEGPGLGSRVQISNLRAMTMS